MVICFPAVWFGVIIILQKCLKSVFSSDFTVGWKWCVQLTVSHFSMSRINPCSSLSVILSIRWSSSKTTFSIGILKNGSKWHLGWLDHDLTMVLAIAALAKNSHECDMLHLKPNKSGTVGYTLYLVSVMLIILHEVRFFSSYTRCMYLNVKVSQRNFTSDSYGSCTKYSCY